MSIISRSTEAHGAQQRLGEVTKIASCTPPPHLAARSTPLFSKGKKPNFNSSDSDLCIHLKEKVHQRICGKSPTSAVRTGFKFRHYYSPARTVTSDKSLPFAASVVVTCKMGTAVLTFQACMKVSGPLNLYSQW